VAELGEPNAAGGAEENEKSQPSADRPKKS